MKQLIFENIYDKYAPTLYGIALEICPDKESAEKVFISTFKNIYEQNKTGKNSPSYFVELIKLILSIAKSEVYQHKKDVNFSLKQFENTPLLQQLICTEENLDSYCISNSITKQDGLQIMITEFGTLKNTKLNYLERSLIA
jgi:hypothetical protein